MSIRSLMTDDHRHCDGLFAAAESALDSGPADSARRAMENFRLALLAHFAAEEETLFPAFEARTGITNGPTAVMRMEHAQMRSLLDAMTQSLSKGDGNTCLAHADTLLILMQQHNLKEENVLYPMCDQHLDDDLPALLHTLARQIGSDAVAG